MRGSVAGPVVALLTLVLLVGCSEPADPVATTSSSSPSDAPDGAHGDTDRGTDGSKDRREDRRRVHRPTGPDVPDEVVEAAADAASGYLEAYGDVLADPAGDHSDLVAGAALDALRLQAEEYALSGWRIEGRPRIVAVEVQERADDRMVVDVCVDNADVRVVDQSGDVVADGAGSSRTLNVLTLARKEAGWVVVESTFGSDPVC